MTGALDAQVRASDPKASVFVAANAGSGKTSTLVRRVARLLLAGANPEAILCVTYTKAGAAEMQRRLFADLGAWAVMEDEPLTNALARIDEPGRELSKARALFARALETPGGLKIQTLHAFCEKLLRRFPLEAGVSPGFTVLEDQAAATEISARARDAGGATGFRYRPDASGEVARAYAHLLGRRSSTGASFPTPCSRPSRPGAWPSAPMSHACEAKPAAVEGLDVWRAAAASPARSSRDEIEREARGRVSAGAPGTARRPRRWRAAAARPTRPWRRR